MRLRWSCLVLAFLLSSALPTSAATAGDPIVIDQHLRALSTTSQSIHVENVALQRDRLQFQFTGDFTLSQPVAGRVRALLFRGQGKLTTTGWSPFERENIHRFLDSDVVDVDFTRAVLVFSDDTFDRLQALGKPIDAAAAGSPVLSPIQERLERETGMDLSAWMSLAILNPDQPGFFFGEFDGGARHRFDALIDHAGWVPANIFGLNAGEKGLIFQYRTGWGGNDVWTAFYDEADMARNRAAYSDTFDLVSVPAYRMDVDVRDPGSWLRLNTEMDLVTLRDNVQLIPFNLNEGLDEYDNTRLKKGLRLKSAALADGTPLRFLQDPWDSTLWIVLPRVAARGEKFTVKLQLEGHQTLWDWNHEFHYLLSNESWFPRHGYLARSQYDITFHHGPHMKVISVGERVREDVPEDGGKSLLTEWRTPQPVALASFAVGRFERHNGQVALGSRNIAIEYYSVPGSTLAVKEDFIVAEIGNYVTFYSQLFGDYPYPRLGAVFFPGRFGQGFPTMLFLPVTGTADVYNFQFMSHEGAHQWWGNKVAWRSYRDVWLSEGFAEYSSLLYASRRENPKRASEMMHTWKTSLEYPPRTDTGNGKGKLADVGPLVMGYRLSSRETRNAYTTLIYTKGALVLRMLHYLFTNPQTGDDTAFYIMMRDFVAQHEGGWATTESFMGIAGSHFQETPIAKKYGLKDLDWFTQQWVYGTAIPKYRLEYRIGQGPNGGAMLIGSLYQEGVPDDFFMPVPLKMYFDNNQVARGTVGAKGPVTPLRIPLPAAPHKVEVDPENWLLEWSHEEHQSK